ncbi:HD domain-containing protein [Reinekea marinisedimentorum]|uniref:HD domain-containing protein n=1 Tax=Reinekea marinisedimentorum TaxID=230495 RepID=UPI003C734900
MRAALVHDIVEIDAGDTWLYDENQSAKLTSESIAANRIFSLLPLKQGKEYCALWQEFENRSSPEAKFAAAIDGISPLLNHLLTGRQEDGVIPVAKVRSKKEYIISCAPTLWPLVENLIEESVASGLYA